MSDKKAKRQKFLAALLAGDRLSKQCALRRFRLWNVGGAVFELRKAGWTIKTEMIEKRGERYAEYYIPKTA